MAAPVIMQLLCPAPGPMRAWTSTVTQGQAAVHSADELRRTLSIPPACLALNH